jgi:bifunctional enzyme CysN/CysC
MDAPADTRLGRGLGTDKTRGLLRLLTCGSVDDGKSTLIGRLLYELDLIPSDRLRELERESTRAGTSTNLDLAMLLDGLEAEQEQGITIDVAFRFFQTPQRAFVVADSPGHEQYTRNMATGASVSDVAVLLVDARKGILAQTRRHSYIVSCFGIRHVILAINKCDLVEFSQDRFEQIVADYLNFASNLGFRSITAIPLSALHGDNVVTASVRTPWYRGPTLLEWLETIDVEGERLAGPMRMPVQWVCRLDGDLRGYGGTLVSGRLEVGDRVMVVPSGREARVARLLEAGRESQRIEVGGAALVVLADELDVGRGDVLCTPDSPSEVVDQFAGHLLWFSETPMIPGRSYFMKIGARTTPVTVTALKYAVDVNTGAHVAARTVELNGIGFCNFSVPSRIPIDAFAENKDTGGFILIDRFTNATVGAGTVAFGLRRAHNVRPQNLEVDQRQRERIKPHRPAVLWFTGLSGAGKSTIASAVERSLNELGCHTYLIDGDNVRGGLNRDLGFTEADRVENVRRVAEVARLFVDAGLIVIVALISPYRSERLMARELVAEEEFVEIFVDTPLEVCRRRDPKGLYAKAARGELVNFTGIDAPYEAPASPELRLTTVDHTESAVARVVMDYMRRAGIIDSQSPVREG